MFSEDEQEEEEYNDRYNYHVNYMEEEHLVTDIIHGGQSAAFLSDQHDAEEGQEYPMNTHEQISFEDKEDSTHNSTEQFSAPESMVISESEQNDDDGGDGGSVEEQIPLEDADSLQKSDADQNGPTEPISIDISKSTTNRLDNDEHNDHSGKLLRAVGIVLLTFSSDYVCVLLILSLDLVSLMLSQIIALMIKKPRAGQIF